MKIVVDENMPLTEALFSQFGEIVPLAGRKMTADDLIDADVLLVRSVTKVNAELLAKAQQLKFVGTATIGTDHIDKAYLQEKKIPFFSAPGCNKISVGEYVISALFVLAERYQFELHNKSIGIIGAGNTGTAVAERARALGMNVLLCDPFKEKEFLDIDYVSFKEALAADVVSFHVPLSSAGEYPTFHLLNEQVINTLPDNKILINACRGEVWDNVSLLKRQQTEHPLRLVMDVWENEPNILEALIPLTEIATPHIAGYSLDGKYRGTYMLYEAYCNEFSQERLLSLESILPATDLSLLSVDIPLNETVLKKIIHLIYDVRRDDALFRMKATIPGGFDQMRKQYQERREWSSLNVQSEYSMTQLKELGFITN